MSLLHKFPLLTREEIASSPSRADGVPESMEQRRRRLAATHMMEVASKLKMSVSTWAIAVTFFNRFYTRKSMKQNNTFIMACASLFLAGKVADEPRQHINIANELIKAWFGKDNPQLQALAAAHQAARQAPQRGGPARPPRPGGADPHFYTNMWEAVLEAERALLFTVGFDFNVDFAHKWVVRLMNRPQMRQLGLLESDSFLNYYLAVVNDIYRLDGTMALQYDAQKIAVSACYFVFKCAKTNKLSKIPQPPPSVDGQPWYVEEGLSVEECMEIVTRIMERTYADKMSKAAAHKRRAAGGAPASTAPSPTTGAASTAMLGACGSAACSAGGTATLGGGATMPLYSELGSGADGGLGEHTSVARPLSSDLGSGGMPSKRDADGYVSNGVAAAHLGYAGSPTNSKRARVDAPSAAAGATEVSSAAMPSPAPQQPGHSPPLASAHTPTSGLRGPPGNGYTGVPSAPAPPASVAAPAAASDKEEGELEDGELA